MASQASKTQKKLQAATLNMFLHVVKVFCDNHDAPLQAVSQAKKRIKELIVAEQAEKTITDEFIGQLSQDDMDQLGALQRELTVSIRLDRSAEDQVPKIHLEGLTRDVFTAESAIRSALSFVTQRAG